MEKSELGTTKEKIHVSDVLHEMKVALDDVFNARVASCSSFMLIVFENGQIFEVKATDITGGRSKASKKKED